MRYHTLPLLLSLCTTFSGLAQESLTTEEKSSLLTQVEALEESVIFSHEKSQVNAIQDFEKALKDEDATYKLFEACRKKVFYEEEKRDAQDARQAERAVEDMVSEEFKRALLHQLYFLRYSLEAQHHPERRLQVAKKLVEGLGQIVKDEKRLNYEMVFNQPIPGYAVDPDKASSRGKISQFQKGLLGGKAFSPLYEDPFKSVFAQAYKVEHLRPTDWMQYPLDFNGLYLQVIIKDLLTSADFSAAREQWATRIKGEATLHQLYGLPPSEKDDTPASYDQFLLLSLPRLHWKAEQLFFTEGDEKAAAKNLISLLEEHPEHPEYLDWVKWLKEALTGEE